MFPDCLAQPANIPRARYPCSWAAVKEAIAPAGQRELQLTPSGEAAARRARSLRRQHPPSRAPLRDALSQQRPERPALSFDLRGVI